MTSMFSTKFKIIWSIKRMKFNDKWIYRGRPEFSWFQKNIRASSSQKQYKWIRKTTDIWNKPERDTKKNTGFSSRRKEQKYIGTLGQTIDVREKPKWFTKGKRYVGASSSQKKDKWIRKTTDIWKKPERDTKKNTGFSSRRKEQKYIGTFGRTIDVRKKPKWITKGKHFALVDLKPTHPYKDISVYGKSLFCLISSICIWC